MLAGNIPPSPNEPCKKIVNQVHQWLGVTWHQAVYLDKFLVILLVLYGSLVVALMALKVALLASSGKELELQHLVEIDLAEHSGHAESADTSTVLIFAKFEPSRSPNFKVQFEHSGHAQIRALGVSTSFLKPCRMGSTDLGSITAQFCTTSSHLASESQGHLQAEESQGHLQVEDVPVTEEVPVTLKPSDLMWYRPLIRSLARHQELCPAFGALLALMVAGFSDPTEQRCLRQG